MSKLSVADVVLNRYGDGTMEMSFPITLDAPLDHDATFHFSAMKFPASSAGFAEPGRDFELDEADLVIPAGETAITHPVTVHATKDVTPQKVFVVTLTHANVPVARNAAGILDWYHRPA